MRTKNFISRWLFLPGVVGLTVLLGLSLFPRPAQAVGFNFEGSAAGGTGSAMLDVTISGNTLTAVLMNTSPTTTSTGPNTPGITGFGFDLIAPLPGLTSWGLTAFLDDGTTLATIGSPDSGGAGTGADGTLDTTDDEWILNTSIAGVTLDFLPTTDGRNIDGALFNPALVGSSALPGGSNDVFFTTATLTLVFNNAPVLNQGSTFVRMQRVGDAGAGSLKLNGTPKLNGTLPIPSTLLLLGIGLLGLSWAQRRIKS